MVSLDPMARAKTLRARLPALLLELERVGRRELRTRRHHSDHLSAEAAALGVASAYQSGTDYPAASTRRSSCQSNDRAASSPILVDALADWLGEFLVDEDRQDVRGKLRASALPERHVFVIVPGFATADFCVTDLLMRDGAPLPSRAPQMPREMTHVWVASMWSTGSGMRWAADTGWSHFRQDHRGGSMTCCAGLHSSHDRRG
jgi:hypothetical protein